MPISCFHEADALKAAAEEEATKDQASKDKTSPEASKEAVVASKVKAPAKKRARTRRSKATALQAKTSDTPESPTVPTGGLEEASTALTTDQARAPTPVVGPITPLATPPRRSEDASIGHRSLFWQDSPDSHRRRTTTGGSSQWRAELFGSDIVSVSIHIEYGYVFPDSSWTVMRFYTFPYTLDTRDDVDNDAMDILDLCIHAERF